MKPILSLLAPMILLGMSCKKDNTFVPAVTTNEVAATTNAPASGTAARPGTPAIKGNWRLRLTGGGIMGMPPMPVSYLKRLRLHADLTYTTTNGTTSYTGTYALSTGSWPFPPGYRKLITWSPTLPTTPPPGTVIIGASTVYQYTFTGDTLSMAPASGADMMYEVYVRE